MVDRSGLDNSGIDNSVIGSASRLLHLLTLLTTRRVWAGEQLAERLAVTTRTVRRDIERLRDLEYRVDALPGPSGGYSLGAGSGSGTGLPPLVFDEDSAVAVAVGLRTATSGTIAGMDEAAARASAALEQVMPSRLRRRVEAVQAATVPLAAGGSAVDPDILTVLALACRDHERLRFGYADRDGNASCRHVEPHRLVSTARRWYLVARDLDRDDWRSFRVDRLRDPQPTGRRFAPVDPPDPARFVSEGISSRPYRWQARVLLDAPAEAVTEFVPATVGVVEAVNAAHCLLVAGSDSLDAIALHVALLDIPFTPLEPPELRERCAALAEQLARAAAGGAD
ncbi:helix-turn-helix transcriptional regulator [Spelaeicoccus albus]|uniref:Putative DNA-binding transcriptional regulator YafY n=1 Tax=Spelaeicoccus albus TaxID=1280376 RepID=A0A7Z0D1U0_9MICO|nr:WYL domain-containing protein [Spelaeicoccus albus]NYI66897.1 putative DNA-binding transcriptional regulator YafY [Spelaeicoccus albus]